MPIRNLGPCACCGNVYPIKAVVTRFSSVARGRRETSATVFLASASADPMEVDYTVYYSDGTAAERKFRADVGYADSGNYNVSGDANWKIYTIRPWIIEYHLPVEETSQSGDVYSTTIGAYWQGADYMPVDGLEFSFSTELGNSSINGSDPLVKNEFLFFVK